ncbi:uncharacterized protein LOC115900911 [Camarhynchus parvulus]|uniref:uncharacterized protein LOC115900911 n=1 Tax=Geospiza parvula TaxID=87175 RepID=UPI0012382CC2|nr:uncharacterized protein LOC115900911 [Camarhynchus parvulus]
MEAPGCTGSEWLVVPKAEVTAEDDPGEPELHDSGQWLVRKVKVEEEEEDEAEAWAAAAGAPLAPQPLPGAFPPEPAGPPGNAGACKAEEPCPEELGYGVLPAWGAGAAPGRHRDRFGAGIGTGAAAGMSPARRVRAPLAARPAAFLLPAVREGLREEGAPDAAPAGAHGRSGPSAARPRPPPLPPAHPPALSHLRTHTGERPYPCPLLPAARKKTHLDRHLRDAHRRAAAPLPALRPPLRPPAAPPAPPAPARGPRPGPRGRARGRPCRGEAAALPGV